VTRELFENTAFIGQIGDSAIDEGSVKDSIENILFSGSEKINNQRAAARISDKMHALLHEGGNGGAIVDLLSREQELTEKLEKCNEDNRRILAKENELHDIRQRRKEAEERRDNYRDLDSCYSNVVLIQTFDQLHLLEEELDGTDDDIEDDIKPSHSYDEAVAELERKLESSISAEKSKLYKDILNVLQSNQYLVQKRVLLNEALFEKCIDFWPTMFDGIECKVDSDGDGVPDEDENDADHFEVN
jgi:hypothetical protein